MNNLPTCDDIFRNQKYVDISHLTEEEQLKIIEDIDPFFIDYIENPSINIQKYVINLYPWKISDLKNPSKEIQLIAISAEQRDREAYPQDYTEVYRHIISEIDNPCYDAQLKAIEIDPWNILFIKNPAFDLKVRAISEEPKLINLLPNITQELILAVKLIFLLQKLYKKFYLL
jgi:hypothetical protein